jgi:hypothetical protein
MPQRFTPRGKYAYDGLMEESDPGNAPNGRSRGRRRTLEAPREDIMREEVEDALAATQEERIAAMIELLDGAYALWATRGFGRDEGLCRFPGITQQRRRGLCRDRGDRSDGARPVSDDA